MMGGEISSSDDAVKLKSFHLSPNPIRKTPLSSPAVLSPCSKKAVVILSQPKGEVQIFLCGCSCPSVGVTAGASFRLC